MVPTYDTYENKVRRFQKAMGQPVDAPFTEHMLQLRMNLIEEEFKELQTAVTLVFMDILRDKPVTKERLGEMLKELADLQYVVSGFAVTFGLPLDLAVNRVHASNMSKLGNDGKPVKRSDGKVLKGPNYQPPMMDDLV